jgi:hypothetical protein
MGGRPDPAPQSLKVGYRHQCRDVPGPLASAEVQGVSVGPGRAAHNALYALLLVAEMIVAGYVVWLAGTFPSAADREDSERRIRHNSLTEK